MKKFALALGAVLALSACSSGEQPYDPAHEYTGQAQITKLQRVSKSRCIATVRLVTNNQLGTVKVGRGTACRNGSFRVNQFIYLNDGDYVR